ARPTGGRTASCRDIAPAPVRHGRRRDHDWGRLRRPDSGFRRRRRMRLLADTHAFLWFVSGDARLSRTARRALERQSGAWGISAATVWEMAIKSAIGRLTLPTPVTEYIEDKVRAGVRVLSIDWTHAAAVESLPRHHGDPFDRLLIAQAKIEGLAIVTRDGVFREYGVRVIW